MFFVLLRAWDKEKILSTHEESNLRPSDSALRCFTTKPQKSYGPGGEVYYEVHMTRVLHTARISNVDSVMFINRVRDGSFCPKLVTRRKTSFSICLPTKKLTISLILFQNKRCSYPHANLLDYYNWQLLWQLLRKKFCLFPNSFCQNVFFNKIC